MAFVATESAAASQKASNLLENGFDCEDGDLSRRHPTLHKKCLMPYPAIAFGASLMIGFFVLGPLASQALHDVGPKALAKPFRGLPGSTASNTAVTRQGLLQKAGAAAVAAVLPTIAQPASAAQQVSGPTVIQFGAAQEELKREQEEEGFSDLGGMLVPYVDIKKDFKVFRPFGWVEFSADPGNYDIKWRDVVEQDSLVSVSSSPVGGTATSITDIGEIETIGKKLAEDRKAQLRKYVERNIGSTEKSVKGYAYEFKGDIYHELVLLTINRGKLYRLNCISQNKNWKGWSEAFRNTINSFVPQAVAGNYAKAR